MASVNAVKTHEVAMKPLWAYDTVQLWVYWRALVRHLRSTETIWIT